MHSTRIPVLGFVAASGTGKTTLLTELIPELNLHGLRLAVIKHSHHNFEVDRQGKDSYRFREAGADTVVLISPFRRAIITEFSGTIEPNLEAEITALQHRQLDIILVEGFKQSRYPKLELHRQSLKQPMLYPHDPDIIGVASDTLLELPVHLALLDINDKNECVKFVLQFIKSFN